MTAIRGATAVVLSAPSGAGKTSIAKALVRTSNDFVFSVSATTRSAREGEEEGVHYHFLGEADFAAMREAGLLLEWAEVHRHLYGTPKSNLDEARRRGQRLILDIDVQGAIQVRERVAEAVLVFVLPPSAEILVQRLRGRGTEERAIVERRLRNAREELEWAEDFDYAVVNEDLDRTVAEVRAIALGEGDPSVRAIDLSDTIRQLQGRIDEILETDFMSDPS